jgi:hypothetical protein
MNAVNRSLGTRTGLAVAALGLAITHLNPGEAQAQFAYTTNNGGITITGYTGPGGDVSIPDKINGLPVTCIGDSAFYCCTNLTSVTIPDSVTSIGGGAFWYCTSLTAITADAQNSVYSSVAGALFNKSTNALIQCPAGKAGSYTIPNSVTTIGPVAFAWCIGLSSVTIPDSVTSIMHGAFWGCTSLTNVTVGNSVTSLGDDAFGVCTSLTNITIPDSVTSIGGGAFLGCTSLKSITIPESVTNLTVRTFDYCFGLKSIAVAELNPAYSSEDGVLLDKSRTTLIKCPPGREGSYTIPKGVAEIRDNCFFDCISLTDIIVPGSVTNFGVWAFWDFVHNSLATNLTGIYFEGDAPRSAPYFGGLDLNVYYLPGTEGWGPTFGCSGYYGEAPTAPWVLPYPVILATATAFGIRTNGFGFMISWATNASIVVEACSSLGSTTWLPVSTNALVNGSAYFSDPDGTAHPARFYRLRSP